MENNVHVHPSLFGLQKLRKESVPGTAASAGGGDPHSPRFNLVEYSANGMDDSKS